MYESLWNLGLFGILLFLNYRRQPPPGSLLGLYLLGYSLGRFWIEGLRADSLMLGPLRVAQGVSLLLIGAGLALMLTAQRRASAHLSPVRPSPALSTGIPAPEHPPKEP